MQCGLVKKSINVIRIGVANAGLKRPRYAKLNEDEGGR